MLNTEFSFKTGSIILTTSDGKLFGHIINEADFGYRLMVDPSCSMAYAVYGKAEHNLPYFKNLQAMEYIALGIYLEYGAE